MHELKAVFCICELCCLCMCVHGCEAVYSSWGALYIAPSLSSPTCTVCICVCMGGEGGGKFPVHPVLMWLQQPIVATYL